MRPALLLLTFCVALAGCDSQEAATDPEPATTPTQRSGYVNTVGMVFARIPAGTFKMGSGSAAAQSDERPVHDVMITQDFFMSIHEVTQGQWRAVMGDNPSWHTGDDNRPVDRVSWFDAQDFIQALNRLEGGNLYRLPTEAEWEYAARAGSPTDYHFGQDASLLDIHAWHRGNATERSHPVGRKQPNAYGLHDTSGNVWEWVQDWYGASYYKGGAGNDPQGPATGVVRVIRGGGGNNLPASLRAPNRGGSRPTLSDEFLGFRLVRTVTQ